MTVEPVGNLVDGAGRLEHSGGTAGRTRRGEHDRPSQLQVSLPAYVGERERLHALALQDTKRRPGLDRGVLSRIANEHNSRARGVGVSQKIRHRARCDKACFIDDPQLSVRCRARVGEMGCERPRVKSGACEFLGCARRWCDASNEKAGGRRLVEYRTKSGSFKATQELMNVKGIGEKTAMKLIAQFGTIEELLRRVEEVTPPRIQALLIDQAENAQLLGAKLDQVFVTHRPQAITLKAKVFQA